MSRTILSVTGDGGMSSNRVTGRCANTDTVENTTSRDDSHRLVLFIATLSCAKLICGFGIVVSERQGQMQIHRTPTVTLQGSSWQHPVRLPNVRRWPPLHTAFSLNRSAEVWSLALLVQMQIVVALLRVRRRSTPPRDQGG